MCEKLEKRRALKKSLMSNCLAFKSFYKDKKELFIDFKCSAVKFKLHLKRLYLNTIVRLSHRRKEYRARKRF